MGGMIESLRKIGVDAAQYYEVASKEYRCSEGVVARLSLRTRMYLLYPFRLIRHCRRSHTTDIRVVCTNTFFAPLAAALAQQRRSRLVHLVYDLYPDALIEAGVVNRNSFAARACERVVRKTFFTAAANVFLGQRLLEHAQSRFGEIPNSQVVAVGSDGSDFLDNRPSSAPLGRPVDVLYCGNLGRLHDVETLVRYLKNSAPRKGRGIAFSFHASGYGLESLRRLQGATLSDDVFLHLGGFLSQRDWILRMRRAEVALVTMRQGAERVLLPSKTYSALLAGQAILGICPKASDLADLILKHDCGWVVEPGDVAELTKALAEIRCSPDELIRRRQNAFAAGHSNYTTPILALQWKALFEQLTKPSERRLNKFQLVA